MEMRKLGRSGLQVSSVAFGTVNVGWLSDDETSFAMLDRAVDQGINLIDTSDNYNAGKTEEAVGRWLAKSRRREEIVLATKCYQAPQEWSSPDPARVSGDFAGPNARGLSAYHIRRACEASLKRLGTDHIDLYQMHHVDRDTPFDEIWQAMETLVTQGKISYVGTSNFAGWHIAKASESASARHFLGPVAEQSIYNLQQRTVELEVMPACDGYGLGFLAYSPLGGGALASLPNEGGENGMRRNFVQERIGDAEKAGIERFAELCREAGHSMADVAFAWACGRPGVTSVISGPRTLEQVEQVIAAAEIRLEEDLLQKLDELFPGPGGPAPEAYAW